MPSGSLGLADVAIAMHGAPAGRFTLRERHFSRAAVLQALAAARLVPITEQPWAPFDGDLAGKTWWVARLGGCSGTLLVAFWGQIDTAGWCRRMSIASNWSVLQRPRG